MSHDLSRSVGTAASDTIDPARLVATGRLTPVTPAAAARRAAGRSAATTGQQHDDELDLVRRVRNFLDQRSVPSLRRLAVEAAGTSIVLRGTVRSYYEKQLALNCCQRVAGVLDVVDAIEVAGIGSSAG
jgi:hypothetical protein